MRGYWGELHEFNGGLLNNAFRNAGLAAKDPQFLPSAVSVRKQAELLRRGPAYRHRPPQARPLNRQIEDHRVPGSVQGQIAYVSEADTSAEQLARLWEVENKTNRRADSQQLESMRDLNARRAREFNQILEKQWGKGS